MKRKGKSTELGISRTEVPNDELLIEADITYEYAEDRGIPMPTDALGENVEVRSLRRSHFVRRYCSIAAHVSLG